jgi:hypothetical protein
MAKQQLDNTNDDEKWQGNNKKIKMSTRNDEIATSNNGGTQKAHWKHPKEH